MVFALGFNPHVQGEARDKSMRFTPFYENDSDDESVHPDEETTCQKLSEWLRRSCSSAYAYACRGRWLVF
jgi:hypothetical protein